MNEYANNDHWKWVQALQKDKPMSEIGKTVANILGYVGYGIYNCPISHNRIDWTDDYFVKVNWRHSLSNWDFDNLTRLVLECHERLIRVEMSGSAPYMIKMIFHQRKGREGEMSERMPTIEEMIERRKTSFGDE